MNRTALLSSAPSVPVFFLVTLSRPFFTTQLFPSHFSSHGAFSRGLAICNNQNVYERKLVAPGEGGGGGTGGGKARSTMGAFTLTTFLLWLIEVYYYILPRSPG